MPTMLVDSYSHSKIYKHSVYIYTYTVHVYTGALGGT